MIGEMITEYEQFEQLQEDDTRLNWFLGMLKKFNTQVPITKETTERLLNYFAYRWDNHKNFVFGKKFETLYI